MHGRQWSFPGWLGSLDRLLDPPCSIGTELAALGGIESLNCFDQANIAFANQVEDGQSKIVVVIGNFDDERRLAGSFSGGLPVRHGEFVWRD